MESGAATANMSPIMSSSTETTRPHTQKVYDHVLEEIRSKRLRPGAWLDRKALARRLGVSLQPVADAVSRLIHEGILEAEPRRGTRVRPVNLEDVRGMVLVREALECQAARLYGGPRVRAHRQELLALAAAADGDGAETPSARIQADARLHKRLVGLAGVPAVAEAFDRARVTAQLLQHMLVNHPPSPVSDHVQLIQALASVREPEEAESLLRAHVRSGKHLLWEGFDEPAPGGD